MKKKIKVSSVLITLVFIAGCAVGIYAIKNIPQSSPVPNATLADGITDVSASGEDTTESAQADAHTQQLANDINKAQPALDVQMLLYCGKTYGSDKLQSVLDSINGESYTDEQWYTLTGNSLHVLRDLASGDAQSNERIKIIESDSEDGTVEIGFVGDINLSDTWSLMEHYNTTKGLSECISPELLKMMNDVDIMFANNEFTFSERGTAQSGKSYTFRSNPKNVSLLKEMGIDVVSVANNHIYDYGEEAFLDTFSTLKSAGIGYVGAGDSLESASLAQYFIVNGRKIAFVSAGETYPQYRTPAATQSTSGILPVETQTEMVDAIKAAAEQSDYVFAYAHWGYENINWYSDLQVSLGKAFVDAGASAVIGSHPHVLQGMEFYNEKLIAYSLGNFWFNTKTMSTGMIKLSISPEGEITPVFYPCVQSGGNTQLKTDKTEAEKIYYTVEGYCRNWGIDIKDDGTITKAK